MQSGTFSFSKAILYVTYQKNISEDSKQTGTEIEITPEMIEAGSLQFQEWVSLGHDELAVAVVPGDEALSRLSSSIFSSMAALSP